MMLWNTLLGINSFVVFPATSMFLVYAIGDAIVHGEWLQLAIALGLFVMSLAAEIVLAIMDDA